MSVRYVRAFLFAFLFFLMTGGLSAAELKGRTVDSSGAILPGVALTLLGQGSSQRWFRVTSDDGSFQFDPLRPGPYLIQAELPGFRVEVVQLELSGSDEIEIEMQVGMISDRIVVTAASNPQLSSENPRTSWVLEAAGLDARKQSSLAEAVDPLPGVRVQRAGGPGAFTTIRFRGLRNADTAVLINGFQMRDPAGFRGDITGFLEDLMLPNTGQIEVTPGAISHLYGTGASGGVVNIVPLYGAGKPWVEARFEAGSLGLFQEQVVSAGSIGQKFHYSIGALRTDVNSGIDGEDVYRNTSVGTFLNFELTSDIKVSGIIHYSNSPRTDLNESPFPVGPPGQELDYEFGPGTIEGFQPDLNDPDNRRRASLFSGIFNWEHRPADIWSYSAYFQNTDTSSIFSDGPEQHPYLAELGVFEFAFDQSLSEGGSQIVGTKHYIQAGQHNLFLVGVEHERESRTAQFAITLPGPTPTTDRQSSSAFFVQDQISALNRKFQIYANFRAQFFTVDNPESVPELEGLKTPSAYTGGLALSYFFQGSSTKVRAQAASGFRAPSLAERFAIYNSVDGPIRIGNPLLRPERSLTIDGGIDQSLFGDRVRLGATYFYNRLQEIITSTSLFQQTNAKGGLSRGAEVSLQGKAESFDWFGSYTFTRADFIPTFDVPRSNGIVAPAGVSRPIEGTADHQWSAGFNWKVRRWNVNLLYTGSSAYDEPLFSPRAFQQVLFRFDGYNRFDVNASYRLPVTDQSHFEFYVKAQNLFDNEYFEDGFRTQGVGAWGGIRFSYGR